MPWTRCRAAAISVRCKSIRGANDKSNTGGTVKWTATKQIAQYFEESNG